MADRRAVNKYYPPDWDPSKGSINTLRNSHPLRHRAKKLNEGILVVRFEMPFNIWCLKCENHIGVGVRYNAEKSRTGSYYSSPIFKFKMKCHLCDNHFEIQSDPAKFDYNIISGARKQIVRTESDESEQLIIDSEESKKRMADAMFRLEKKVEDKIKSDCQLPNLHEIKSWRTSREDSFSMNQLVRSQFRRRRKEIEKAKSKDRELLSKASLSIPLLPPSLADREEAVSLMKQRRSARLLKVEAPKKKVILNTGPTPKATPPLFVKPKIQIKREKG